MRTTQQMSITLPYSMANEVKKKVVKGDYASESEVIREGLRALLERDRVFENWLQNIVCHTYDAMKANPTRARTVEQVRARINTRHANQK